MVVELPEMLRPCYATGQRTLDGEGMDIAPQMHPTPLVQTKMSIVAAVEI